jgi:hypothetical protein
MERIFFSRLQEKTSPGNGWKNVPIFAAREDAGDEFMIETPDLVMELYPFLASMN